MSPCTNPILDGIYDNGRKTSLVYTEFSLVLLSATAIFKRQLATKFTAGRKLLVLSRRELFI